MRIVLYILISLLTLSCTREKTVENTEADALQTKEEQYSGIIIHSYSPDHICGAPQATGIKSAFEESGMKVEWKEFFMNSKITNITIESREALSERYMNYIKGNQPDIVFLLDDNAVRYVGIELIGMDFPVVFSGLNGQPEKYNALKTFIDSGGKPLKNMTGVYEYLYSAESFITFNKILPDLKNIVALVDSTATGKAVLKQLEKELETKENIPHVEIVQIKTISEYVNQIEAINNDDNISAVYNLALSLEKPDGTMQGEKENFRYFLQNCRKPGIALNYEYSRLGLFGGVAVDFTAMGNQAAEMGMKLLRGTDISELPIEDAEKYMVIFNKARARALNISIPKDIELVADQIYYSMALMK